MILYLVVGLLELTSLQFAQGFGLELVRNAYSAGIGRRKFYFVLLTQLFDALHTCAACAAPLVMKHVRVIAPKPALEVTFKCSSSCLFPGFHIYE